MARESARVEGRHFHPGPDWRARSASPTNSISGIGDGVCSEGQAVQPREAAGSPGPASSASLWTQPRVEVGVVPRTTTRRGLPQGVRGADGAGPGAGGGKARAEAMPGQAAPQTPGLPQRRRPRPRRLFPGACPLLLLELQLHQSATGGTTLLGETPGAALARRATDQLLRGKIARPSRFEGRTTGTIAAKAAAVLPQQHHEGKDKVAGVGARAARENEAGERADPWGRAP